MYSSLRINRKEGETSSLKEDSKKVAKMSFRYITIAITFVVCMIILAAIESQFIEPNRGVLSGNFVVSAMAAGYVGEILKNKLGL